MRHQVGPRQEVVQLERAVAEAGRGQIVRADVQRHRGELRRRLQRQGPGREGQIARSGSGKAAAEPVLPAQPGHGVLTVGRLVHARREGAARAKRAAAALEQHVIAAFGERPAHHRHLPAPAVRGTHQHRRPRLRGDRRVVVGQQDRAVAHRHPDIAVDGDLVALGSELQRSAHHAGQDVGRAARWTGTAAHVLSIGAAASAAAGMMIS